MENKEKYHYSDFTEKNYRRILETARQNGYEFIPYKDINKYKNKFIILRHDVDFSPHRALVLARIENGMQIKSTYCVQLGSLFYNIFEKEVKNIFFEIKKMGHSIGLHFDPTLYDIDNVRKIKRYLSYEKDVIGRLLKTKIKVFSFHNPGKEELGMNDFNISGLINVYSYFFTNEIKYISDSNGYWRFERLKDVLLSEKYGKLHILIHPGWWQKEVMSPWERVLRCVEGRKVFVLNAHKRQLHEGGRKNIGCRNNNL